MPGHQISNAEIFSIMYPDYRAIIDEMAKKKDVARFLNQFTPPFLKERFNSPNLSEGYEYAIQKLNSSQREIFEKYYNHNIRPRHILPWRLKVIDLM